MKLKKILCITILVAVITACLVIPTSAQEVTVKIDGEKLDCNVPARIENGSTMVPMRAIFEALGMTVNWNNEERSVTATKGEDEIKLVIGKKTLYLNGEEKELNMAPFISEGSTLVPVRAVSESVDATVEWVGEKNTVEITTAEYEANKDKWKENTGTIDVTGMTATGNGVTVNGNTVLITDGGDFTVTGENSNVLIHVNTKYKVKLRLEGVKLENPANPVIFFENSEKSLITISKGTENYITDGEEYTVDAKAAIFSNDDIEIKGEGTLYVTSKAHHAIASDDDIKIEEGTLNLTADKKDGIHANNTIKIKGGDITITAKGDGIQSEEDVVIENGSINVTTTGTVESSQGGNFGGFGGGGRGFKDRGWMQTGEAVRPECMTRPEGGMMPPEGMTPPEGGMMPPEEMQNETAEDEAVATKGIKAETNLEISGGTIVVNSADHALHSAGTLNIKGGEISLTSDKGKGISAHGDVSVDDGVINILKATEGLESKANLTINGGTINIKGSDDGINAGGTNGRDAVNRQDKNAETGHDLFINGGDIFVNASGDGLDANGRMIISGGNIIVEGPTNNGNGALDSGGVIRINGGTLIALGASGMAETPDNESLQPSFRLVTSENIPQGSSIVINNAAGEEIYSYTTIKTGNSIVFSSDKLKVGETYTVTIGETAYTVEMTSNVTNVGSGGGFGGGRRW